MDQIDVNLARAWHEVTSRLRDDPDEVMKRYRRTMSTMMTCPPKPLCLCLRASDTRISPNNAYIGPPNAIEVREGHTIELDGDVLRELCKPITIPWPGLTPREAAKVLGLSHPAVCHWINEGVFTIDRYEPGLMHRTPRPVRIIYTPSPLDMGSPKGRPPDPAWGTMWQWLWEKLPENYTLTTRRVPRLRPTHGRPKFMGWCWICPGLLRRTPDSMSLSLAGRGNVSGGAGGAGGGASGYENIPCGRLVERLFAPMSLWTLPQAMGWLNDPDYGFDLPPTPGTPTPGSGKGLKLTGRWRPGEIDPLLASLARRGVAGRSFACAHCWKPIATDTGNHGGTEAWNLFVSHVSGGLLYGHEVKRPQGMGLFPRKNKVRADKGVKRGVKEGSEVSRETVACLPRRLMGDQGSSPAG
ncbi:MAG: hypothetical protein O7G85_02680 [Planctomycetota bacterium]|nr:hypothetical protein [Planctomycetota bacterium]